MKICDLTPRTGLELLAAELVAEGMAVSASDLDCLAVDASVLGVSSTLVTVMTSAEEPLTARVRAYGRVSARVLALSDRSYGGLLDRGAVTLAA